MNQVLGRLADIWKVGRRIVLLGIGSPLKADDSVGLFIVEQLQAVLPSTPERELHFIQGELAPENFSGEIREFGPTHVIFFDAADLEAEPGSVHLIEHSEISGTSFSTHVLPLKILANYLICTCECEVVVVGIQSKDLEFDRPMTSEVKRAAAEFVKRCGERLK